MNIYKYLYIILRNESVKTNGFVYGVDYGTITARSEKDAREQIIEILDEHYGEEVNSGAYQLVEEENKKTILVYKIDSTFNIDLLPFAESYKNKTKNELAEKEIEEAKAVLRKHSITKI